MKTFSSYYEQFLIEKIKLKKQIAKLEKIISETDLICNNTIAKKYHSLKTNLNFTEDALAQIRN